MKHLIMGFLTVLSIGHKSEASEKIIYSPFKCPFKEFRELKLDSVHFIGMSTGGFVGMRIAFKRPDLIKSLILIDTSAEEEPRKSKKKNNLLIWMVKNIGWFAVIRKVMPILFHQTFLKDGKRQAEVDKWRKIVTSQNKLSMAHFGHAIFERDNVLPQLPSIKIPTAVIVGEKDIPTPVECSKKMTEHIPDARYFAVPDAGHSAAIEKPKEVNRAIQSFYSELKLIE